MSHRSTGAAGAWFLRLALALLLMVAPAAAGVLGLFHPDVAAAASCLAEQEPDDQPDTALGLTGAGCLDGTLPDGDAQDTWVWTVGEDDARHTWTITISGIPETTTGVELVPITSAPGVTPIAWGGQALLMVSTQPGQATATATGQLIPEARYVLGVGRTGTITGATPASFDYRVDVGPGDAMPPAADVEPNDDPAHAGREQGAFEVSGDSAGSQDVLGWKLDAQASAHSWDIVLQAGLGTAGQVQLVDSDGGFLTSVGVGADGIARIYDLRLSPGTYDIIVVGDDHVGPQPYILRTLASDVARADPEPDDDPSTAAPMQLGSLVTGRLARTGDVDQFRLSLDGTQTQDLVEARLIWRGGPDRRLCVSSVDGTGGATQLQCSPSPIRAAGGSGAGTSLDDLYLRAGDYVLTVTGDPDPSSTYSLRMDTTSRPAPDHETEPDDSPSTAVSMAPTVVMHGWATPGDTDIYRVVVTDDARLWTVQVSGSALDGLLWIDPLQSAMSTGDISPDRSQATIDDAYLPPGEHLFQVTADGGDYTLSLTPQGPRDAHAEIEPDDDSTHAVVLPIGQATVGRLPTMTDVDAYRFSLAAPDHIRLDLDAPPDGAINAILSFQALPIATDDDWTPGASWSDDLQLQPGDYELWLRPRTPSASPYQVLLTREDPFATRPDQEPNDSVGRAGPMPPSLHVSGTRDEADDQDWFRLGPMAQPATITVVVTGTVNVLGVSDGTADLPATQDAATQTYTIGPTPTGVPLFLHVAPGGDYGLSVSGVPAPDGPPVPAPDLAATLALSLPDTPIAAYWDAGQRLTGDLTITSRASADETLSLDAATSHDAWNVTLGQGSVDLAPGASVTVPLTIDVLPDAWADARSASRCVRGTVGEHRRRRPRT